MDNKLLVIIEKKGHYIKMENNSKVLCMFVICFILGVDQFLIFIAFLLN